MGDRAREGAWIYGALLAVGAASWLSFVAREVDGPYLDEYFHIRQALVYFDNKFDIWDPKITTPPGLYLLSYPWLHELKFLHVPGTVENHLRVFNTIALLALWHIVLNVTRSIRAYRFEQDSVSSKDVKSKTESESSFSFGHVALNIALFPPLFFFSGLYYTDIVSALFVLKAHEAFFSRRPVLILLYSLASLTLRQTNVFWTAIYLGAMELKRALAINRDAKQNTKAKGNSTTEVDAPQTYSEVMHSSWKHGTIYDRRHELASQEDYLKTVLSLAIATVSSLRRLVLPLLPHVLVISLFAAFVVWNGGVVLGDRSNHIASLHVPQMLYIWPYILFFSFPVVIPTLLAAYSKGTLPVPLPDTAIALLAAAVFWIFTNTIVHPFTLADNRHYTFYVFRILLRYPAIKFLAAPVYIVSGWASLTAFGSRTSTVLIWLIVTTLSVVTAPLVEPRYFILPWIIWRMNVGGPEAKAAKASPKGAAKSKSFVSQSIDFFMEHSLWLETAWLVLINAATGYIFLNWTFEWPQEPGATMRFMW